MKKIAVIVVILLCSCTKVANEQGEKTYQLNPETAAEIEAPIEATGSLLTALTPLYPPAGAAGVAILTALGIWRKKIKPKYEKAQTEANLYHTTTHALVTAIEEFKENSPEAWLKLKEELNVGPNVENVIRAIRNLPIKE